MKYFFLVVFLHIFDINTNLQRNVDSNREVKKQDYIIQIQNGGLDTVKAESHKFGLRFKRKLVSNIFLFEGDVSHTGTFLADDKGFKDYFADKIEHIKLRENVIVKYHTWGNKTTEKSTFEQWVLQPVDYANMKQCWPYYGMDIQDAWSLGYTGLGVNVAVVDIGVNIYHPDLKRNIDMDLSYSFVDQNHSNVNPKRFWNYIETDEITSHGTMAAGLIGGEFGNQACSAGVAFNAKIAALKVFQLDERYIDWPIDRFAFSVDHIPSALGYKRDDIHVYSCSFNLHNKFKLATDDMKTTLEDGVLKGRKGKGSIYVFSAGNRKGQVYDCNMEALANSIYTITISSVGLNGSKPSYAIPCATTLASTYGEYNTLGGAKKLETTSHGVRCSYFIGTSASTALASGIIALTLQANTNLTWRDIQHIIVLTSTHERLENPGHIWENAAGLKYNSIFGFGLMNATAMALLAKNWSTVPSHKQATVHEIHHKNRLVCEDTIAVPVQLDPCENEESCVRFLEHVQVNLKYRKKHEALMDILICSPSNSCSILLNKKPPRPPFDKSNSTGNDMRYWNFTTVHFWGENPIGIWIIVFYKSTGIDQKLLELEPVTITLFGTSIIPSERFYKEQYPERNKKFENAFFNLTELYNVIKHRGLKDIHPPSVDGMETSLEETHVRATNYEVSVKVGCLAVGSIVILTIVAVVRNRKTVVALT